MKFKDMCKYLFFIVFVLFANKSFSEEKSAFLDLNYLITKSTAGISINKQLNDLKKKNIAKLNKMEKDINERDKKLISQKKHAHVISHNQLYSWSIILILLTDQW